MGCLGEGQGKWQKCCFKGCERSGLPTDGYAFYACTECLEELERLCEQEWLKKHGN